MGYCLIKGGGKDGRYDIELDFGKAQKTAILAALTTAINKTELNILQTSNEIAEAEQQEAALGSYLRSLEDLIANGTAKEKAEATIEWKSTFGKLSKLRADNEPLRYKLRQLKFVRASLRKQAQTFNLFQPIQRKQAWCADLTEDRAAGSYVGTLEVKGEPDLVLIQPGARAWLPTDGRVTGREIMSPWQAYWNAAVLPGWQKWRPTYRWGTLTAINRGANTGNVALADATSSAQRLDVNRARTLAGVPFSYMTCHHEAFEIGDRVIIEFAGQQWSAPNIIGFLDSPKSCYWPDVLVDYVPFRYTEQVPFGANSSLWAFSIVTEGCGTALYPSIDPQQHSSQQLVESVANNVRFAIEEDADTFTITSNAPFIQSWGTDTLNSIGADGYDVDLIVPGSSPGRSLVFGNTVYEDLRPFTSYSFPQYSTVNGVPCVPEGPYSGLFWSLTNLNEGFLEAKQRYTRNAIGQLQSISVQVNKGSVSKMYAPHSQSGGTEPWQLRTIRFRPL